MGKINCFIKKVHLALYNIISMLRANNRLLILVMFSISVSVFGILFYSGYFLYSYYTAVGGSSITIELSPSVEREKVWHLVEQISKIESETEKVYLLPEKVEEVAVLGAYNSKWNDESFLLLGNNHSLGEDTPSIIMAEYMVKNLDDGKVPVGLMIECNGEYYQVTGIVSYTEYDGFQLPIKYYALHYDTKVIELSYSNQISFSEKKFIKEILDNSIIVERYSVGNNNNPFLSEDFLSVFLQILVIFSIVVVNAFSMAYYWITHFKRNYRIYAVCGASKQMIQNIIIVQNLVVMFVGVIIGNIVYVICQSIVKDFGLVYQGNYDVYVGISAIVFVILIIFSIILSSKVVKSDVIYNVTE